MPAHNPTDQPPLPPESIRSAPWRMASLSVSMLLASLGTSIANVALPFLAEAFAASFQSVQWVMLTYLIATTSFVVSAGRLGDAMGRRRLLLSGIVLYALASILAGLASTLPALVAARAFQGLGAAIMMALSMAFAAEATGKRGIGSAVGLLGTMSAVGTALGPTLGGLLIAALGWRGVFLVNVPICIASYFLVACHLPRDRREPDPVPPAFDVVGTLVLAATLAAYSLASTMGRNRFGPLNVALLLAAALGAVLFVRVQRRVTYPLLPLAMFRDAQLRARLATSALVATVIMTTLVVGPFYLAHGLGLEPAVVGLVLSAGPFVAALAGAPAGRLVDRFGTQRTTVLGLGAVAVGALCLSLTVTSTGIIGYTLPLMVVTAGYALFQTANNAAAMKHVPADQRGLISGLLNLSRNLGLITGVSLMGALFTQAAGSADLTTAPPSSVAAGMRMTFTVAALVVLLALVFSRRTQRRNLHRTETTPRFTPQTAL